MATELNMDSRVAALEQRVASLERTVGAGLMGTVVLLELVTAALDGENTEEVREKALLDAQNTLRGMRKGFGG